jgi:hypothetical protein
LPPYGALLDIDGEVVPHVRGAAAGFWFLVVLACACETAAAWPYLHAAWLFASWSLAM